MQTGKSHATVPIINRIGESFERVVVLCDSRAAYAERRRALEATYGSDQVGQFSADVKDPKLINVAMMQTLVNHLDKFSPDERTLILLDEAITTQQPTVRQILHHFGLGTVNTKAAARAKRPLTPKQLKRGKFIPPSESEHLLVGLSGTGGGLDGYHVVGRYDMLDAINDKRVRHLVGDQVSLGRAAKYRVTFEEKKLVDDIQIWWRATSKNARVLAKVYFDRIYENPDTNGRDMIFVPTIKHGDLLLNELKEEYVERGHGDADAAEAFFGFVHSGGNSITRDESINDAEIDKWRAGGALLSVAKLNKSFPATGTGAIFHTYQTTSDELFAQRTGRGWGNNSARDLSSLFVLEATWSRHQKFSNLAKLLGFVDYPKVRLDTRDLIDHIPQIRERVKAEKEMEAAIDSGAVAPMFQSVPLVMDWRTRFKQLAGRGSKRIAEMARKSRIPEVYLQGFAQGGLPTRLAQVEAMAPFVGDLNAAIDNWADDWRGVIVHLTHGARIMTSNETVGAVPDELGRWKEGVDDYANSRKAAEDLDQILASYFGVPLTGDEMEILQNAVSVYADQEGWQSAEIQNKRFPEDPPKKISAHAMGAAMFGHITEPQRASLMDALIQYYDIKMAAGDQKGSVDWDLFLELRSDLLEVMFARKGWIVEDGKLGLENLRYLLRAAISARYGEKWPARIGSNMPIPPINWRSTLYKWLYTDLDLSKQKLHKTDLFLSAARLLYSLTGDYWDIHDSWEITVNGLLEAVEWNDEGNTKGEKLRYEVRVAIASAFFEPTPSIAVREEAKIGRMSKKFVNWLHGKASADFMPPALSAEISRFLKRARAYRKFQEKPGMDRILRSIAQQKKEKEREQRVERLGVAFANAGLRSIRALRLDEGGTIEGNLGELWSKPATPFNLNVKDMDKGKKSEPKSMEIAINHIRALIHALQNEKAPERIKELKDATLNMAAVIANMNGWPIGYEIERAMIGRVYVYDEMGAAGGEHRSSLVLRASMMIYLTACYGMRWPTKSEKAGLKLWLIGSLKKGGHITLEARRALQELYKDMGAGLEVFHYDHDSKTYGNALDEEAWPIIENMSPFRSKIDEEDRRSQHERSLLYSLRFMLVVDMGGGLDVKDEGYKGWPSTPDSKLISWLNGERIPLTMRLVSDIKALINMKKDDGEYLYYEDHEPREELEGRLAEWIREEGISTK
jgi:hypothetical protein